MLHARYPNFRAYLENLYGRKESWAHCFREQLPVRGNHTNNYAEAAMRILKDKILYRTKAFNVPQLLDFFLTRLNAYYEARITAAALGQWEHFQKSRFLLKDTDVKPENISQVSVNIESIHCRQTTYMFGTLEIGVQLPAFTVHKNNRTC